MRFSFPKVGTWKLEVRVNGAQIIGSPFGPKIETPQIERSGHGRVKKRHSSSAVPDASPPPPPPAEEPVVPAEFLSAFAGMNSPAASPEPTSSDGMNANSEFAPEQSGSPDTNGGAVEDEAEASGAEGALEGDGIEDELNIDSAEGALEGDSAEDVLNVDGAEDVLNVASAQAGLESVESDPDDETLAAQWIVIYDYAAQDADELSVEQGDIVINVADISPGWAMVSVESRVSVAPIRCNACPPCRWPAGSHGHAAGSRKRPDTLQEISEQEGHDAPAA